MPEAPLEVAARVAAATAHEFNNHLAAIALQAELALVGAGEDEKLRRRLEGILGSCDAARAQTRALLAFGARRPLHSRQLDVGEALDRRAGPGVQVAVPEQRLFVDVDPDAFDEAVAELIAHAATPVTLSAQAAGDVVEIEVRHGGDAPDEEARRRIFEPYFAEDEERPLGLAVVWGFVRQSGGTIELQAAPGGGAVVIVRLPRAGAQS